MSLEITCLTCCTRSLPFIKGTSLMQRGFNWCPDRPLHGPFQFTCLACCDMDGSEKLSLVIIGKFVSRGLPMKRQEGNWDLISTPMIRLRWQEHCFYWLTRLDNLINRTYKTKILLNVFNCSAHGHPSILPALRNFEVGVLPPNATSNIAPLAARIIAAVMTRYNKWIWFPAFDNIDANAKHVYNVDIFTAMKWVQEAGVQLSTEAISKCWRHFLGEVIRGCKNSAERETNILVHDAQNSGRKNNIPFTRIVSDSLLNPLGEEVWLREIRFESQVEDILSGGQEKEDT